MFVWFSAIFVIFLWVVPEQSSACNGIILKLHYLKTCNPNSLIKFSNATVTLDKDCNIIPKGCIQTPGFKSAMVHLRAEKSPIPPIETEKDLCALLQERNEYALMIVKVLGLSDKCPVGPIDNCGTRKVNISKYKSKLGIALGVSTVNMTVKHDNGDSCIAIKSEFIKPRRRG